MASVQDVVRRMTDIQTSLSRFILLDSPNDTNLPLYEKALKSFNVRSIVRVCDPTYDTSTLEAEGFKIYEMSFSDGCPPPEAIVTQWLQLCHQHRDRTDKSEGMAVHCCAGLGRSPVLVAIALTEEGMDPLDAVTLIRNKRRGAINRKQLEYIEIYAKKRKKSSSSCCNII